MNSNNVIRLWWRSIDQKIIFALAILFCFSMLLVTTAGPIIADKIGINQHYFTKRQLIYLLLSIVVIIFFSSLKKHWIKKISIIGFLITFTLLILVKFIGYEAKGAIRWISVLGISLQPSEFIKPFFSIVMSWILSLGYNDEGYAHFLVCIVIYALVATLLIIQPDFGMLIMVTIVFCIQLFVGGISLLWTTVAAVISIIGAVSAYFHLPHVASRINNFLNPENILNYQVNKSIIAFERGGIYGQGPGEGTVKQYLPDAHSDFIFAVAGEEFGAIVCIFIITVFAFIVLKSLIKAIHAQDKFTQIAIIGIASQFGLQVIINIGVTLNLLPTKGMTLPFISYGGSSTLAISIGIGVLLSLTKRTTSLTSYKINNIHNSI